MPRIKLLLLSVVSVTVMLYLTSHYYTNDGIEWMSEEDFLAKWKMHDSNPASHIETTPYDDGAISPRPYGCHDENAPRGALTPGALGPVDRRAVTRARPRNCNSRAPK